MDSLNTDLIFNMAQLLKERVGATRKLHFDTALLALDEAAERANGVLEAHNLRGDAKVTRLGDGLLVQGDVLADVLVECSRCLEEFSVPVDAYLEEQFQSTYDVDTGHAVHRAEPAADDTAFQIDQNHLMDLTEPVRQALLVALPMKPLCREDCKGICAECGANLNEGDCGHKAEKTDDRWAGLRVLNLEDFSSSNN